MIITRTPLRISIGGGGTDLPSYYSRFGGFFISAAINKYIYISLNKHFKPAYLIKYSISEETESVDQIKHPIVREAFKKHQIPAFTEMVSMADIHAGTGLGSSGTFNVGLLTAIHAHNRSYVSVREIADEACDLEINILKEPVGKQDQFIAAFGGLNCFEIDKEGHVKVTPLKMKEAALYELQENLLMFYTGMSRSASAVLKDQKDKSEKDDKAMIENLHFIKDLGYQIRDALEAGDTDQFGRLMHKHWETKKARSGGISNENINRWYDVGHANGALGGKLIGAGGGGFLLFYAQDKRRLREAMAKEGLPEVHFNFDFEGTKVIAQV